MSETTDTPDAFDALRADTTPIDPPAHVRARLRADLTNELERLMTDTSTPNPSTVAPRPVGVMAYLTVRDAAAAIEFYVTAFGAVEDHRMVGDDGRIGHAEITIGSTRLALADEYPEADVLGPETLGGSTTSFHLTVDDVDRAVDHAVEHGATLIRPTADQFHGSRIGVVRDPFGHRWMLSAPIPGFGGDAAYEAAAAEVGFEVRRSTTVDEAHDHQIKHYDSGDLYYFTLQAPDVDRAKAFFGAALGWEFPDPQGGHIGNISAPPGGIAAGEAGAPALLYFVVDDAEAVAARVRELGGTAAEPVHYASGWDVACTDDQGTPFHLSVPAPQYRS